MSLTHDCGFYKKPQANGALMVSQRSGASQRERADSFDLWLQCPLLGKCEFLSVTMSEVFLQMGVLMCVLPFPYVPSVCPVSLVYEAMPEYMQPNLCLGAQPSL